MRACCSPTPTDAAKRLTATYAPLIDARASALLAEVKATYAMAAATWKVPATEPAMSALEQEAARTMVQRVAPAAGAGGAPGGGPGGFGAGGRPRADPRRGFPAT